MNFTENFYSFVHFCPEMRGTFTADGIFFMDLT